MNRFSLIFNIKQILYERNLCTKFHSSTISFESSSAFNRETEIARPTQNIISTYNIYVGVLENGVRVKPSKTELTLFTRKYEIPAFTLRRLDDIILELSNETNALL